MTANNTASAVPLAACPPVCYSLSMIGVSPDIQFFVFGDNGVLFHPGVNRLWVLNPVAATIWCLLPDCRSREDLHVLLARHFGIGREQAAGDAALCLEYFAQEGLLAGGRPRETAQENPLDIQLEEAGLQEPDSWQYESFLQAPGAAVRFVSEDSRFGGLFMNVLRYLEAGKCLSRVDATIALAREAGREGWSVFLDGRRYVGGVPDDAVLPHLYFLLFVCASRGLGEYFLLHGAVLEREGRALVLPGVAKSGKTTLTAMLAAGGWRFFSDELAVLDVHSGRVGPFPLPMSIKPGSVAVLQSRYPELSGAEVWNRVDGQQVRYLLPAEKALPASPDVSAVPAALVFPRYDPNSETRLGEISKVEALQRLAATGSSNRPLRREDVEALIALIERIPAYSLRYRDADLAVAYINAQIDRLHG